VLEISAQRVANAGVRSHALNCAGHVLQPGRPFAFADLEPPVRFIQADGPPKLTVLLRPAQRLHQICCERFHGATKGFTGEKRTKKWISADPRVQRFGELAASGGSPDRMEDTRGMHRYIVATVRCYNLFLHMSLIVVGSVAYDGVETPHGKVDRMLGGAATYIALSAGYFTKVGIVAVVGDDFAQEDHDLLASRGFDLSGLERVKGGKTFFWAGKYSQDMNDRQTLRTDLNVFADFNPKLPETYRKEPYLFLGNIQPELQRHVRQQMNGVRLTGGDTMNYWINDYRPQLLATLKQWDFLLINDSEARLLSGKSNLRAAAQIILDMGPHTLIIKRGEYGAILFQRKGHFMAPGYLLGQVFDPTGAGDCFAGGFIGYLAGQGISPSDGQVDFAELRRAVIYGSVMGSFCCESFGVDRFRTLTREDIEARYHEFKACTEF
jgi:sugar/nucleoside kinase (ribokinase family)